ncbi:MAG: TA system VapC family ribonuclease toxin [Woeseia sp.]
MRALLDVNVLIALLDSDHSLHDRAMEWIAEHGAGGWASCPLTQNGCIRIMSHSNYPNAPSLQTVMARLSEATADPVHEFWPDDVSLLDSRVADPTRVHGPRQITDIYLLALAVRHGGRLVTFDGSIAREAVRGAESRHLLQL